MSFLNDRKLLYSHYTIKWSQLLLTIIFRRSTIRKKAPPKIAQNLQKMFSSVLKHPLNSNLKFSLEY